MANLNMFAAERLNVIPVLVLKWCSPSSCKHDIYSAKRYEHSPNYPHSPRRFSSLLARQFRWNRFLSPRERGGEEKDIHYQRDEKQRTVGMSPESSYVHHDVCCRQRQKSECNDVALQNAPYRNVITLFEYSGYPSKITCAIAWLSVCVMLTAIFFTPILAAIFPASPANSSVGLPLASRTTSKSTHRTPRRHPVPSAFIAASFAANRPAYRSYLFLNFSQYALSRSV